MINKEVAVQIQTINYNTPHALAQAILANIKTHHLVHITQVPLQGNSLHLFYDTLTNAIGHCLDLAETESSVAVEGKWTYVCYNPAVQNAYRSSLNPQPLHTDSAYQAESPDITCMYCIKAAPQGGETIFISGEEIVAALEIDAPDLLAKLLTTPVCFSRTFSNGHNQKISKIIARNPQGGITLNWNYHRIDPASPTHVKQLCEDFHAYLQKHIVGSKKLLAILLQPGEGVLWLDNKVLHGRNSFVAQQYGDRHLGKTCIKLKELVCDL